MEDENKKETVCECCCEQTSAPAPEAVPASEAPAVEAPVAEQTVAEAPAAECCCSEAAPAENAEKAPAPKKPVMEATQQMADDAQKILETMLDKLGLTGTVKSDKHTTKINLLVSSPDAGRIIGRKGTSLEALQLLLNRMLSKGDFAFPKVYIDIDGYSSRDATQPDGTPVPRHERSSRRFDRRDRGGRDDRRESGEERRSEGGREEVLRRQALDAAKEVRHWGEDFTLPEMNAHDRRIIHITLENEPDITTESVGEGNTKRVIVKLKNK